MRHRMNVFSTRYPALLFPLLLLASGLLEIVGLLGRFGLQPMEQIFEEHSSPFMYTKLTQLVFGLVLTAFLLVFTVYQYQRYNDRLVKAVRPLLIGTCLWDIAWVLAFCTERLTLAALIAVGWTMTVQRLFFSLDFYSKLIKPPTYWCVYFPIMIYAGFTLFFCATSVMMALFPAHTGFYWMEAEEMSAYVVLLIWVIGAYVMVRRPQWPYAATLAWGFAGVFIMQMRHDREMVGLIALAAAVLMALIAFRCAEQEVAQPRRSRGH